MAQLFSHIVSLGWRCRVSRRLRDHFGFESAYPFDWWQSPADGLARLIEDDDLDRLYDPERLRVVKPWSAFGHVEHRDYGLNLAHEFPRLKTGHIAPGWRGRTAQPKARTAALMAKFHRLDRRDRRVLFVREHRREDTPACLGRLRAAICARAPKATLAFLLISDDGLSPPGWESLKVRDPGRTPWEGDPAAWDPALAGLGVRLRPPAGCRDLEGVGAEAPARDALGAPPGVR